MRFVASADWQLGMAARFLDAEARPRYAQARLDAVRRIGQLAASRKAAFVVVCGDVFESNQLDRRIVERTFEAMRDFSVPVLLLPGNHDPLDAASIYNSPAFIAGCPDHVVVLRDHEPFEVIPGVEVVAAPWLTKHPTRDPVAEVCAGLEPATPGTVRVLVGHGAVSTLSPDRDDPALIDTPALRRAIDEGRVHVAVLGDRHSTTQVDPAIWYPGTPEVTAHRETDPGNVIVLDVASDGLSVEKVRVGMWRFLVLAERLNSLADVEAFRDRVLVIADKERTACWLALSGTLTMPAHALLQSVLAQAGALFARFRAWERHTDLAVLADEADFRGLDLGGFAEAARAELAAVASGDNQVAETARDALGLLYRFAGGGAR
jgi:DNA repair exonuclease SbcCD nuclease subunit